MESGDKFGGPGAGVLKQQRGSLEEQLGAQRGTAVGPQTPCLPLPVGCSTCRHRLHGPEAGLHPQQQLSKPRSPDGANEAKRHEVHPHSGRCLRRRGFISVSVSVV